MSSDGIQSERRVHDMALNSQQVMSHRMLRDQSKFVSKPF